MVPPRKRKDISFTCRTGLKSRCHTASVEEYYCRVEVRDSMIENVIGHLCSSSSCGYLCSKRILTLEENRNSHPSILFYRQICFHHFTPSKATMPLRGRGLQGVKEYEEILARRKNNKRTGFRQSEDVDWCCI